MRTLKRQRIGTESQETSNRRRKTGEVTQGKQDRLRQAARETYHIAETTARREESLVLCEQTEERKIQRRTREEKADSFAPTTFQDREKLFVAHLARLLEILKEVDPRLPSFPATQESRLKVDVTGKTRKKSAQTGHTEK